MKKKVVFGLLTAALTLGLVAGASAAPVLENISAQLNWATKFVVNSKEWAPQDSEGNKLAPIVYNNTTYLPIRSVSEALGVAVKWDGETQTVYLGERTEEVPIASAGLKAGAFAFATSDKQYTVQDGVDYGSGIVLEKINTADKEFTLQPNGQYQKLSLTIFTLNAEYPMDVKVIDDNDMVLAHEKVNDENPSVTLEFDIGGAKNIEIQAEGPLSGEGRLFVTGTYR